MWKKEFVFYLLSATFVAYFASKLVLDRWTERKQPATDPSNLNLSKYPPFWDEVPSNFDSFPVRDDSIIVDPWNYIDRMTLYKILLNFTEPSMAGFGPENEQNVLWGLPLQHGWQMSSGRLWLGGKDDLNQTMGISPCSWWANMNYFLSVIPFVGAGQAGLYHENIHYMRPNYSKCVNASVISKTKHQAETPLLSGNFSLCQEDACSRLEKEAIERWKVFFMEVTNVENNLSEDEALHLMREAHIASIEAGILEPKPFLEYMSSTEFSFGQSVIRLVGLIAITGFPTTFNQTNYFQVSAIAWKIQIVRHT